MTEREYAPATVHSDSSMTKEYRDVLLRLLASHARAELGAADAYASWIRRAPGPDERMYTAQFAQEETEHWYKHLQLMQELGVQRDQVQTYQRRNLFYPMIKLVIPRFTWLDLLLAAFLIDRGAAFFIEEYAQSSYAPWSRLAQEILAEEAGHADFGRRLLQEQIQERGRPRVQRRVNRWWWIALNFFGPPRTRFTDAYLRFGLRTRTNEERRQAFRRSCEPQIEALGLQIPTLRRQSYPYF